MKKHSSILAFIAILALVVMSCNFPLNLSAEPQTQRGQQGTRGD